MHICKEFYCLTFCTLLCAFLTTSAGLSNSTTSKVEEETLLTLKTCCATQKAYNHNENICSAREIWSKEFEDAANLEFRVSSSLFPIECVDGKIDKKILRLGLNQKPGEIYNYPDKSVNILHTIYGEKEYCIDSSTPHNENNGTHINMVLFICEKSQEPIFKKCCDWGSSFNEDFECTKDPHSFLLGTADLPNYDYLRDKTDLSPTKGHNRFTVNQLQQCAGGEEDSHFSKETSFTHKGNVIIQYDISSPIEMNKYCLEIYYDNEGQTPIIIAGYCGTDLLPLILGYTWLQLIYSAISSFFILLTILVYLLVWKKHGVNAWMQFAFIVSAFCYFSMRVFRRSYEIWTNLHPGSIVPDRLDNFFTLGLFANLVNLSFHMFYTFWNITPPETGGIKSASQLTHLFVSVSLCWVLSAGIVLSELFLGATVAILTVKYILIALLILNIVTVIATAFIIWRQLNNRKALQSSSTVDFKLMVKLSIKLFCFTGMIWSLKVCEQLLRKTSFARGWFWDTLQFVTYTYGVVIFIVFAVTNEKILKALWERFPVLKKCLDKSKKSKTRTPKDPSTVGTVLKSTTEPLLSK